VPDDRRTLPARFDHLRRSVGADDDLPLDPDLDGQELDGQEPRPPSPGRHPSSLAVWVRRAGALGAVFVGGALGTGARDALESAWPAAPGHFPTATFVINTTGAFVLGAVLTVLVERLRVRAGPLWRSFVCAGVLGGWTTYSTFVVEADTLAKDGHAVLGAGYVALTLVCGLLAAGSGIALGRARVTPAGPDR